MHHLLTGPSVDDCREQQFELQAKYSTDSPVPESFDLEIGRFMLGPPKPASNGDKVKLKVTPSSLFLIRPISNSCFWCYVACAPSNLISSFHTAASVSNTAISCHAISKMPGHFAWFSPLVTQPGLYSVYCSQVKVKLNLHGVVGVESVQQVDEEEYEEKVKRPVVKVVCLTQAIIACRRKVVHVCKTRLCAAMCICVCKL